MQLCPAGSSPTHSGVPLSEPVAPDAPRGSIALAGHLLRPILWHATEPSETRVVWDPVLGLQALMRSRRHLLLCHEDNNIGMEASPWILRRAFPADAVLASGRRTL